MTFYIDIDDTPRRTAPDKARLGRTIQRGDNGPNTKFVHHLRTLMTIIAIIAA